MTTLSPVLVFLKNEILEETKISKYNHLEDLSHWFHLRNDEIIDIPDFKKIPTKRTIFSLNPGMYEITDINRSLEHVLPDNVKKNIRIDDIKLKSKLKINQTLIFT